MTTASDDAIPAVGEVLAGKYRIDHLLGRGGMGVVLGAHHLHLDERVAIKFLLPELARDPGLVARFLREGRAAIKIRSEHVVRVLDVATLPGGTPYMAMEYLEGCDLAQLLEKQGKLAIPSACDYLLQAIEALAEAHALGMVHRDLKPSNLFLAHRADGSPCVKVLDFGITKQKSGHGDMGITSTQAVMGSPRYMSPEQMRSSRAVDARSDIWSLGVILHELLTGAPPFDGDTMPELLVKVLQDDPVPLADLRPDAPVGLQKVVALAMQKDPNARFHSVGELARALAPFGTDSARASAERITRVLATGGDKGLAVTAFEAPAPAATGGNWSQTNKRVAARRRGAVTVAVGIVAAAALGLGLARKARPPENAVAPVVSSVAASVTGPASGVVPPPPVESAPSAAPGAVTVADSHPPGPVASAAPAPSSAPAASAAHVGAPSPPHSSHHPSGRPSAASPPASPPQGNALFDGRQ